MVTLLAVEVLVNFLSPGNEALVCVSHVWHGLTYKRLLLTMPNKYYNITTAKGIEEPTEPLHGSHWHPVGDEEPYSCSFWTPNSVPRACTSIRVTTKRPVKATLQGCLLKFFHGLWLEIVVHAVLWQEMKARIGPLGKLDCFHSKKKMF